MKIKDPLWRLNNLYTIVDKNGQRIKFKENSLQAVVNRSSSKRKMILKSRQIGFSTNELLKQFDATIWTPNFTACILAHEDDALAKLFRIVTRAYEFMDPRIRPKLARGGGSKHEMYFPEVNSRIYCDLESRGDTIQWLHVSEAAFSKDTAKLNSTLQAVPLHGRVTLETTPNGMGNHYYEKWVDQDQPYEKFFFPWYMFPEYKLPVDRPLERTREEKDLEKKALELYKVKITDEQLAFRRFKKAELKSGIDDLVRVTFEQEYPEDDVSCFLASGEAWLDLFKVKELKDEARPPIFENDYMRLYEPMDKTKTYVLGADTAEGVGGDFSVGVIMNTFTKSVAGFIRGHWKPSEFATKLVELADRFKAPGKLKPMIAVERNNHGHAVILALEEIEKYENLYRHDDEKIGWKTDKISRPIMINAFKDAVENKYIKLNDKCIFSECLTLVNKDGKIEAADGKHDDSIIATAIALQLVLKSSNLDIYEDIEKRILL